MRASCPSFRGPLLVSQVRELVVSLFIMRTLLSAACDIPGHQSHRHQSLTHGIVTRVREKNGRQPQQQEKTLSLRRRGRAVSIPCPAGKDDRIWSNRRKRMRESGERDGHPHHRLSSLASSLAAVSPVHELTQRETRDPRQCDNGQHDEEEKKKSLSHHHHLLLTSERILSFN